MYAQSRKNFVFMLLLTKNSSCSEEKSKQEEQIKLIFTIYLFTFRSTEERRSHHADDVVYLKSN